MTREGRSTRARALGSLVVLAVMTALALGGCAPVAAPQSKTAAIDSDVHTLTVDGVKRNYVAHVPEGAQVGSPLAVPVLLMLHGAGGNAQKAEVATGLTALAESNNFIVVYPSGTQAASIEGQLAWNAGDCCGAPRDNKVDDVKFIRRVLDDVESKYAVDTSRVYLAGFSNGGMMSYRLSCELGKRIAGLAVVSGAFNVTSCESHAPASVLIIHGTGDLTVPYRGGPTNDRTAARFGQWNNASVSDATRIWVERDACDTFPSTDTVGITTRATYPDCSNNTKLEVVTIANGAHVWPIAPVDGFDASEFIVHYFGLDS